MHGPSNERGQSVMITCFLIIKGCRGTHSMMMGQARSFGKKDKLSMIS